MPESTVNADQLALEANPIRSITLDSVNDSDHIGFHSTRAIGDYAVCFTSGTMIRTPTGDVPIDTLKVGDLVTTMDNGPQPVRWIGRRSITHAELLVQPNLRPVLIPSGRMGNHRDLLVSPQHGLLWGQDHLVRAIHAVQARQSGIRVANGKREVTYFHLMFDAHEIIFAEGAPSESFYPGPMAKRVLAPPALRELRYVLRP